MRVLVAVLAAWAICLISTPQPAPSGQKAADTAQQNVQPDKHTAKPSPSPMPSADKDTAQHPANQNGGAVKGGENELAVRVVSLPPRSTGDTVALVCTVVLTLVGIGGIIAAFCTLRTIQEQTGHLRTAAEAARDSANAASEAIEAERKSTVQLNRPYLTIGQWMPRTEWNALTGAQLRIYNPSRTAARIESVEWQIHGQKILSIVHRMLTPKEGWWYYIPTEEVAKPKEAAFLIAGKVTYRDIFHRIHVRTFATYCLPKDNSATFHEAQISGLNDEENWDKEDY